MQNFKKIKLHFKKNDPIIFEIISEMDLMSFGNLKTVNFLFFKLCREIISQQLASKAAEAIFKRFLALFPKNKVTPVLLLQKNEEDLRKVGMSYAKARYLLDLANKTKRRELKLKDISSLDDEEVILELTKVKGIGRWTAEMFLIFTLGREDIFSSGDLGLRNAVKKLYGFDHQKDKKKLEKLLRSWTPYKSYASLALWKSLDK